MPVDVSGILALAGKFTAGAAAARPLASVAVRKTALDIESRAKSLAPVRTGNLRASIGVTTTGDLAAEVGPTANYGKYVEFGTWKMAPRPYMSPAMQAVAPGFLQACRQIPDRCLP